MVGDHDISIILSDSNLNSTEYNFKLTIVNTPPYFKQQPNSLKMQINSLVLHALPNFEDQEFNSISVEIT